MFRIPTPVILIVGLTVATCVIAYWSDNLGKKLGKKRISLLGLRPKQTATLISMLTSVGIMLLTLAALMLFSSQVRDAVLRAESLRHDNQILGHDNQILRRTSSDLTMKVVSSRRQAEASERRASLVTRKADLATNYANKRVAGARVLIHTTSVQLVRAQGSLKEALNARELARRGESAARARAQQAQFRLSSAQTRLSGAEVQLGEVNLRLREAGLRLRQSSRALNSTEVANRGLLATYFRQAQELAKGRAEVLLLKTQQKKLRTEIDDARVGLAQLQAQGTYYGVLATALGTGKVIVDLGQVFAEVVVPPNADPKQLHTTLQRLLESGAQTAIKLGGQTYVNPDTGINRALHLATLPGTTAAGALNENSIVDGFLSYLATLDVPVSVRLVSARRYAEGETHFEAQLLAVPVRLAYKRGDTIAEAIIDGSAPDAQIFNQILALVNAGGDAARAKNVIPLLTVQNPDFFVPDTKEQMFGALRKLQARAAPTKVRLVASEDLYTVDSVSVRFVLDPS